MILDPIRLRVNSAPGIAIGSAKLASVDFEGTIFISRNGDNDWVGSIFSFQVIPMNYKPSHIVTFLHRIVPIFTCS